MMTIQFNGNETPSLPLFTQSHTLTVENREQKWMPAAEIVRELEKNGIKISKQTLFVHEAEGKLHTRRISPRKVHFELGETLRHFNTEK